MNVLACWTDSAIAEVAARLGTNTAQRRDDVRNVLHEAQAVPAAEQQRLEAENKRLYGIIDEKIDSVGRLVVENSQLHARLNDLKEAARELRAENKTLRSRIDLKESIIDRLIDFSDRLIHEGNTGRGKRQ